MSLGVEKLEELLLKSRPLFEFDDFYRNEFGVICGIDEAGRGPLAGDVFAAAVVLRGDEDFPELNDSKKLSEKKRERLFSQIVSNCLAYCIATASVKEIDELNILNATLLAMKRAYEGLNMQVSLALVDGNQKPDLPCEVQTVVKGDGVSASIAAASILAKVARDRYMCELDKRYPLYQFARHKGYGTKIHNALILEYGPSEVHRMSFLKKLYVRK